jgi:hypothetical protein
MYLTPELKKDVCDRVRRDLPPELAEPIVADELRVRKWCIGQLIFDYVQIYPKKFVTVILEIYEGDHFDALGRKDELKALKARGGQLVLTKL